MVFNDSLREAWEPAGEAAVSVMCAWGFYSGPAGGANRAGSGRPDEHTAVKKRRILNPKSTSRRWPGSLHAPV